MSQIKRVAKTLRKNHSGVGITPKKVAKLSGVPIDSVYRRVYDLRTITGLNIYTNRVCGKTYYKLVK